MLEVRNDNATAFEELVARYQGRLMTVLMHLVGNRSVTQGAIEILLVKIGQRTAVQGVRVDPAGEADLETRRRRALSLRQLSTSRRDAVAQFGERLEMAKRTRRRPMVAGRSTPTSQRG